MDNKKSGLEYALTLWADTRNETITREEAAQIVEKWAGEVHYIPCSLSADFQEGWEAACETVALALRIKDMTLTKP